jgi:hypothetical protein
MARPSLAQLGSHCPACGRKGSIDVSLRCERETLRWTEHFECGCGHAFRVNGSGQPSPALLQALRARHGAREIVLLTSAGKATLAVLRAVGGASGSLARLLRALPARVYEGTPPECELVAGALKRTGARVRRGRRRL